MNRSREVLIKNQSLRRISKLEKTRLAEKSYIKSYIRAVDSISEEGVNASSPHPANLSDHFRPPPLKEGWDSNEIDKDQTQI